MRNDGAYCLWDPDLSETTLAGNLEGEYTLPWLFRACGGRRLELWIYHRVESAVPGADRERLATGPKKR